MNMNVQKVENTFWDKCKNLYKYFVNMSALETLIEPKTIKINLCFL